MSMRKKKLFVYLLVFVLFGMLLNACVVSSSIDDKAIAHEQELYVEKRNSEVVSSSIRLSDLSLERLLSLYEFYHLSNLSDFHGETIFRNMFIEGTYLYADWRAARINSVSEERGSFVDALTDWEEKGSRSDMVFEYRSILSVPLEGEKVLAGTTFFDGRKEKTLHEDEVVVSKYAYYTLYAETFGLELDEATMNRVIDDENKFAKYVLLRNCNDFLGFPDGIAYEYYGLDQQIEPRAMSVVFYSQKYVDSGVMKTNYSSSRIVGYYDTDGSALATHKTDLNNMCGYNYDNFHTPGFYRRWCEYVETSRKNLNQESDLGNLWFLTTGVSQLDIAEDAFLGYEIDETIAQERMGAGLLAQTIYVYGK